MPKIITGGCRCGAMRYEAAAEPLFTVNCFCNDCQKFYGGDKSSAVVFPRDAVEIAGEVTYFEVTGGSGQPVSRGFCPTCGTPLFGFPEIAGHLMSVTAGSLDDASWFRPAMNVYTCRAQPWAQMAEGIPSFEKLPDQIPEA